MGQQCCAVQQADTSAKAAVQSVQSVPTGSRRSGKETAATSSGGGASLTGPPRDVNPPGLQNHQQLDVDERSDGGRSAGGSSTGSRSSSSFGGMPREQRQEAKRLIKEFVRSMVKGKEIHVALPTGSVRTCFVSLTRELETLKIKANKNDNQSRSVSLADIEEIVVGTDTGTSAACEGLETPLDELSVTLALSSAECITFRMSDVEARDTLVMCLTFFSTEAKARSGI